MQIPHILTDANVYITKTLDKFKENSNKKADSSFISMCKRVMLPGLERQIHYNDVQGLAVPVAMNIYKPLKVSLTFDRLEKDILDLFRYNILTPYIIIKSAFTEEKENLSENLIEPTKIMVILSGITQQIKPMLLVPSVLDSRTMAYTVNIICTTYKLNLGDETIIDYNGAHYSLKINGHEMVGGGQINFF